MLVETLDVGRCCVKKSLGPQVSDPSGPALPVFWVRERGGGGKGEREREREREKRKREIETDKEIKEREREREGEQMN
jgi:hypothetical protein